MVNYTVPARNTTVHTLQRTTELAHQAFLVNKVNISKTLQQIVNLNKNLEKLQRSTMVPIIILIIVAFGLETVWLVAILNKIDRLNVN